MHGDVDMVGEQYGQAIWSNFPVSDVPRPGLRLGSLNDAQREAAMALLRVLLSDRGYRKVLDIMGSDQALADSGTPYASGRAAYTLAIFGTPRVNEALDGAVWRTSSRAQRHHARRAWRPGASPDRCLPAIYTEKGKTGPRPRRENDKAFALLDTLDDEQRKQAIIDHAVSELALGPGHDGETVQPAGVKASTLNPQQRAMLFDLIFEWAGILNDAHAAPRLAEIRDGSGRDLLRLERPYDPRAGPERRIVFPHPGAEGS